MNPLTASSLPPSGMGVPLGGTNTHSNKRARVASPPDIGSSKKSSVYSNRAPSANQNVFLIIKRTEGSFEKISPFYIQKGLEGLAGNLKNVKRLRNGTLLVETANSQQAANLRKAQCLGEYKIETELHSSLNYSKGVVSSRDLVDISVDELKAEWASEGIVDVQSIMKRVEGALVKSESFILTFNSPKLPEHVKAGFLRLKVRPYVPNPMRCFNCQRFGHTTNGCRGQATCGKCGKATHEGVDCTPPAKCVNCSGEHPVWSRDCRVYLEEKKIQEIKTTQRISYAEAKKLFKASQPPVFATSFASILHKPVAKADASTQTEVVSVSTNTCVCPCNCQAAVASGPVAPPPPSVKTTATNTVDTPVLLPVATCHKSITAPTTVPVASTKPPKAKQSTAKDLSQVTPAGKQSDTITVTLPDASSDSAPEPMELEVNQGQSSRPKTDPPPVTGSPPRRKERLKVRPP